MRIISGKYRGRKLDCPTKNVRPTLDRVKETMFNIIQFDIADKNVLDLFGCSGGFALESMSRGAKSAVIVDNDKFCVAAIKSNCVNIDNTIVMCCDYGAALSRLNGSKFGLIFVDPPYESGYYMDVFNRIIANDLLEDDGIIVVEHRTDMPLTFPTGFQLYKQREIGRVSLKYLIKG